MAGGRWNECAEETGAFSFWFSLETLEKRKLAVDGATCQASSDTDPAMSLRMA